MAELPRLNGIIKALEEGGVAFVGSAPADGLAGTNAPYDGALFEMEHGPYDIRALQEGLQRMLDRRQIAQRGLAPAVTPIVRIPPNQGQSNWVAKQVLDIGVYGIIWPHVDTVEDAYNAVAAMRYPRAEGRPRRNVRTGRALGKFGALEHLGEFSEERGTGKEHNGPCVRGVKHLTRRSVP